jgi:hypothetical protein
MCLGTPETRAGVHERSDHDDLDRADVTEICSRSTEAATCADASSSNRQEVPAAFIEEA